MSQAAVQARTLDSTSFMADRATFCPTLLQILDPPLTSYVCYALQLATAILTALPTSTTLSAGRSEEGVAHVSLGSRVSSAILASTDSLAFLLMDVKVCQDPFS